MDVARHKDAVLKACLQPWINEAYTIIASIEANLTQLRVTQERIQGSSSVAMVTKQSMDEVQQEAY